MTEPTPNRAFARVALVEPAPALNGVPQGLRYRLVRAGVHISRKELCRRAVAAL